MTGSRDSLHSASAAPLDHPSRRGGEIVRSVDSDPAREVLARILTEQLFTPDPTASPWLLLQAASHVGTVGWPR
jgi:hypothetical protein